MDKPRTEIKGKTFRYGELVEPKDWLWFRVVGTNDHGTRIRYERIVREPARLTDETEAARM